MSRNVRLSYRLEYSGNLSALRGRLRSTAKILEISIRVTCLQNRRGELVTGYIYRHFVENIF